MKWRLTLLLTLLLLALIPPTFAVIGITGGDNYSKRHSFVTVKGFAFANLPAYSYVSVYDNLSVTMFNPQPN